METDPTDTGDRNRLKKFKNLLQQVSQRNSGIPNLSYISILLKYFIANLSLRVGDTEGASVYSKELIDNDIAAYYGHMNSELTIEPMLIVLNHRFDLLLTQLNG